MSAITLAFIGQSNCGGVGNAALSYILAACQAREWIGTPTAGYFTDGLQDPMSRNLTAAYKSQTGSMVPACCLALFNATGRQVLVSHNAVSGSSIHLPNLPATGGCWKQGRQYLTNADKKIGLMLASPECDNPQLTATIISLGESDGRDLMRYPGAYAPFPDGLIVEEFLNAQGQPVSYPTGYPNPNQLIDAYSLYRELYLSRLTRYPGSAVIVVGTGEWLTQKTEHLYGARMMRQIQRKLVADLQAQGHAVYLVSGTENFQAQGWLNADGVHYNQYGLNWVGERVAAHLLEHLAS